MGWAEPLEESRRKRGKLGHVVVAHKSKKKRTLGLRLDVPMVPVPAAPRRTRVQDDPRGSPPPTRVLEAQRGAQWHLQEGPSQEHHQPGQPQGGSGGLFVRTLVWEGMGKGCRASHCPPKGLDRP